MVVITGIDICTIALQLFAWLRYFYVTISVILRLNIELGQLVYVFRMHIVCLRYSGDLYREDFRITHCCKDLTDQ